MSFDAVINEQDRLLTVNSRAGEIKNALPGVHVTPLFLDLDQGIWTVYARFEPNTVLPRHYHSGTVNMFTTKGAWYYREHPEDLQVEGSYLYEPAGSIHTFVTSDQGAEAYINVMGANVNLNDDDTLMFIMDAQWIAQRLVEAAKATGQKLPAYIRPGRTGMVTE